VDLRQCTVTVIVFCYLTDVDIRNFLMESEDKLYKNIVHKCKRMMCDED